MPINTTETSNNLILAALMALATDWDHAEQRMGRRGEYRTTGANMIRMRELTDEEKQAVVAGASALGMDVDEEDLEDVFSGTHEYQASFAVNRFTMKNASYGGLRLTQNEARTIERLRTIAERKPEAVQEALKVLDRADRAA